MKRNLWRKIGIIAAVIIVSGLLRAPYQDNLLSRMRAAGFHPEHEDTPILSQLGVESAVVVLGGLRYLVAAGFQIETVDLWEAHNWEELSEKYRFITMLQPKDPEGWRTWGWHMAYNASAWYQLDSQQKPEIREALARHYIDRGKAILIEGLKWNPDDVWIYRDLANIYKEKDKDFCSAADVYLAGSKVEDAPSFMYRFYGYMVADCPGREKEAYEALKGVYDYGFRLLTNAKENDASAETINDGIRAVWKPTLITSLRELEEKLDIAAADRIPERFDSDRFRIISPFRVEKEQKATEK